MFALKLFRGKPSIILIIHLISDKIILEKESTVFSPKAQGILILREPKSLSLGVNSLFFPQVEAFFLREPQILLREAGLILSDSLSRTWILAVFKQQA